LITIIAISFIGVYIHQAAMKKMLLERDSQQVQTMALLLSARLEDYFHLLERVDGPQGLADFDGGVAIFDLQGTLLEARPSLEEWEARLPYLRPYMAQAVAEGQALSSSFSDPISGQDSFGLIVSKGERLVAGVISWENLFPLSISRLRVGKRGVIFLVDEKGVVLYHPDPQWRGRDVSGWEEVIRLRRGESGASFRKEASEEVILAYAPIPAVGWGILLMEPWADAAAPLLDLSKVMPLVLLVTALISGMALLFGVRYIAQPLQRLRQQAARLAWGDFSAVDRPVGGVKEIETLHQALGQMARQIQGYQTALRDYLATITLAQEEERKRIAQELHDDTVQTLIALSHQLERCEKAAQRDPSRLQETLEGAIALAQEAMDSLRRIIRDLRPIYLEDLGLLAALEMLIRHLSEQREAPQLQLEVKGAPRRLSSEVELALFRIAQEALNNVLRHSYARKAQLTLEFQEEGVLLTVVDDGRGFVVPETPYALAHRGHFGLMGIRERALRLGGHLSLHSRPGQGTSLAVFIPYSSTPIAHLDKRKETPGE